MFTLKSDCEAFNLDPDPFFEPSALLARTLVHNQLHNGSGISNQHHSRSGISSVIQRILGLPPSQSNTCMVDSTTRKNLTAVFFGLI